MIGVQDKPKSETEVQEESNQGLVEIGAKIEELSLQDKSTIEIKTEDVNKQEKTDIETKAQELSKQELANLKVNVVKQFEFYFSKYNLPKDKYLKGLLSKDPEYKVEVDELLIFNKVKKYQPYKSLVLEALKDSKILEVKGEKVGLMTKIDLNYNKKDVIDRSICLSNFDRKEYSNLREELHGFVVEKIKETGLYSENALLEEQIGRIDLHTYYNRKLGIKEFKGSVFVEFTEVEYANKFFKHFKQNNLEFNDRKLRLLTREQYESKDKMKKLMKSLMHSQKIC